MLKKTNEKKIPDFEDFEVFPWDKNFETGNNKIDTQHKTLVVLLNKLARTLIVDNPDTVNSAFFELADYAKFHFTDEEKYWNRYMSGDYWAESHKQTHATFLPSVLEIKEDNPEKPQTEIIEDVVKFLIRWLAFHILDSDKRISIAVSEIISGSSIEDAKLIADKKMNGSIRVLIETILKMYEGLSSSTINLMRERNGRIKAEEELREANKRLEALSITDQLTGLYNRRNFLTIFDHELKRARRDQKALTYMQLDIDFFKLYNDTYGHPKGDEALEKVSAVFKKTCRRPDDFIFRIGGEEFGIIAANLSEVNALEFGENIRMAVENLKIPHIKSSVNQYLTVSIGLVNRIPSLDDKMIDFIKSADDNLYKAKEDGRNQVFAGPLKS